MIFVDERKLKINGVEIIERQLGSACEVTVNGERVTETYEQAIRKVVNYFQSRENSEMPIIPKEFDQREAGK